ncbi:MAG TPA: PadR family transcriptional regulator, partial [Actinoplanes sp.]|nr:PadR family transcriptional regulator [Actinoplanes sp.]
LLDRRIEALAGRLAGIEAQAPEGLPRLFLIEDEYRTTLLRAELDWLRRVVADLDDGSLTWSREMIEETLARFG